MKMRVTQHLLFESSYRQLDQSTRRLLEIQLQAASGKRVLKPSDDALSAQKILDIKASLRRIDPGLRNGQYTESWLNLSESSLGEMEDALVRAEEVAVSQSSGTASASTRQEAAEEIKQIYDLVVQLANTRMGDRYIFGGTETQVAPVQRDDLFNPTYSGNDQDISVRIHSGQTIKLNVNVKDVLESNNILTSLRDMITALEADDPAGVVAQLDVLKPGLEALNGTVAEIGSRINSIDSHAGAQKDLQLSLQETLSEYEDADMALVFTDLVNQQTVYQAALKSTAMVTRMSLVDFLS
jgi:flagellar hook-associated protein 3 FlgL